MSFLLNKLVNYDGEMEPKFSVLASFFLCMIMFGVMFTPANGEKFSLSAISDLVQDVIEFYQVTLFSLQIFKCCLFSLCFLLDPCYLNDRHLRDIISREL